MDEKKSLKSILEEKSIQHFMVEAEMAQNDFQALRNTNIISELDNENVIIDLNGKILEAKKPEDINMLSLQVPRKPGWSKSQTKEELYKSENEEFLNWRRGLAKVEEENLEITLTPYEKNIEVWR